MSSTREAACNALFAVVSSAYAWASTPTRRLKLWANVPAINQPALFQFEGGVDPPYAWAGQPNPKRTIQVKLFAYFQASDANPGATTQNAIIQAIDAALAVPPGSSKQTLGNLVDNARVKQVLLREPGDIDGQGIVIVEIELILP